MTQWGRTSMATPAGAPCEAGGGTCLQTLLSREMLNHVAKQVAEDTNVNFTFTPQRLRTKGANCIIEAGRGKESPPPPQCAPWMALLEQIGYTWHPFQQI